MKTFEDFYVKKDYTNALQTLEKHAHELPLDLLHYNLGTIYAKTEKLGLARYHFLMAQTEGMSRAELKQNQDAVAERLDLQRLEKPLDLTDHLIKASLYAQGGILTSVSLIILIAGLLILKKAATLSKVIPWLILVVIPIGFSFWIGTWARMVSIQPVEISDGPSAIFKGSGELPEGVLVITKGDGEWKKIIYPSRFGGWVKSSGLKKLE